jgi:hypothetical protein
MKVVRVNCDDTMKEITIKSRSIVNQLSDNANKRGSGDLTELYTWNYQGNIIHLYGWFEGNAGFENKHEVLPSGESSFLEKESSEILLYGDIFITCTKQKKLIDIDVSGYGEIYSNLYEMDDDCSLGDEDSFDEDEDDDEMKDFIVDDKSDEEVESENSEYELEEELLTDDNEYNTTSDEECFT